MFKTVEMVGHIIDSLLLSKVLNLILENDGNYKFEDFQVGYEEKDQSFVKIKIESDSEEKLKIIVEQIRPHGAIEC